MVLGVVPEFVESEGPGVDEDVGVVDAGGRRTVTGPKAFVTGPRTPLGELEDVDVVKGVSLVVVVVVVD